eukprot:325143_1
MIGKFEKLKKREFPKGIVPCGADALRFGLGTLLVQRSINLNVNTVIGYRLFCNKVLSDLLSSFVINLSVLLSRVCPIYLECIKPTMWNKTEQKSMQIIKDILYIMLRESFKLMHPFMPFNASRKRSMARIWVNLCITIGCVESFETGVYYDA